MTFQANDAGGSATDFKTTTVATEEVSHTVIEDGAGNNRAANVTASNKLEVEETNSAAILADTANMDTNIATIAGAVSGSEMQVDIVNEPTFSETNSDTINTNIATIAGAVSGTEVQADVLTTPAPELESVTVGGAEYTVQTAFVNATASGDTAIVSATASKTTYLLWAHVNNKGSSDITVKFNDGTSDLTSDKMAGANGGGGNIQPGPGGFVCKNAAVNRPLNINLSATGTVGVDINYIEV